MSYSVCMACIYDLLCSSAKQTIWWRCFVFSHMCSPDGFGRLENSLFTDKNKFLRVHTSDRQLCCNCKTSYSKFTLPSLFFHDVTCAPCRYTSAEDPCRKPLKCHNADACSFTRVCGRRHLRSFEHEFLQSVALIFDYVRWTARHVWVNHGLKQSSQPNELRCTAKHPCCCLGP